MWISSQRLDKSRNIISSYFSSLERMTIYIHDNYLYLGNDFKLLCNALKGTLDITSTDTPQRRLRDWYGSRIAEQGRCILSYSMLADELHNSVGESDTCYTRK